MAESRKVPEIGRGPQQFTRSSLPPIETMVGPPMSQPGYQTEDLAAEIYSGLVVDSISAGQAEPEAFAILAKHARTAAKVFFEVEGHRG